MKSISICVAVVALTAATVALGAGPAQAATTICKHEHPTTHTCSPGEEFASGTTFEAVGKAAVFASPIELKCKSRMVFTTTAATGAPLEAKISTFEISSCSGVGTCSGSISHAPFLGKLSWTTLEQGSFEISSGGSGGPEFKFSCGTTVCTYKVTSIPATMVGGPPPTLPIEPPHIDMETAINRITGPCVTTGSFGDSLTEFTTPTELWVEQT